MASDFDHDLPFQNFADSDDAADWVDNLRLLHIVLYTANITAQYQHRRGH